MSESDYINRVIASLKKVPEKHLRIIDLANTIKMKDGAFDYDELSDIEPEVNMAIAEAKMYGTHTLRAVDTLKNLSKGEEDVGP